jgi:Protein of unknown function (DUF1091)
MFGNVLLDIDMLFLEIHVNSFKKGTYVPTFFAVDVNFCDFLKKKNSFPVMGQIFDHIRKYGKLPDRCPIKKARFIKAFLTS